MTSEITDLERSGWEALSSGADAALDFYGRVLDTSVTMLLPGGLVITERADALESMSGAPWSSFALADVGVTALTSDTALVTYSVTARRSDAEYSALISSVYVRRDDGWRMAFHQQTPS